MNSIKYTLATDLERAWPVGSIVGMSQTHRVTVQVHNSLLAAMSSSASAMRGKERRVQGGNHANLAALVDAASSMGGSRARPQRAMAACELRGARPTRRATRWRRRMSSAGGRARARQASAR
jgi:hypothetical protein